MSYIQLRWWQRLRRWAFPPKKRSPVEMEQYLKRQVRDEVRELAQFMAQKHGIDVKNLPEGLEPKPPSPAGDAPPGWEKPS